MAAQNSSDKSDKPMTKNAFIRGFDPSTPADDVVAKGKEAGLDLTKKSVWNIQSALRIAAGGGAKKAKAPAKKPGKAAKTEPVKAHAIAAGKAPAKKSASSSASAGGSLEHKLKLLIVEVGTARAEEIYRSVRHQLSAITSTR